MIEFLTRIPAYQAAGVLALSMTLMGFAAFLDALIGDRYWLVDTLLFVAVFGSTAMIIVLVCGHLNAWLRRHIRLR